MKRIFLIGLLSLAIPASADAHKLGYDGAKRAAQKRADHFAKARTEIKTLFRTSRHSYYAQGR